MCQGCTPGNSQIGASRMPPCVLLATLYHCGRIPALGTHQVLLVAWSQALCTFHFSPSTLECPHKFPQTPEDPTSGQNQSTCMCLPMDPACPEKFPYQHLQVLLGHGLRHCACTFPEVPVLSDLLWGISVSENSRFYW